MRSSAFAAVLLGLALAGCSGGGQDDGTGAPPSASGTVSSTAKPTSSMAGNSTDSTPVTFATVPWTQDAPMDWSRAEFTFSGAAFEWAWIWQPFGSNPDSFGGGGYIRVQAGGSGAVTAVATRPTTVHRWNEDGRLADTFAFFLTDRSDGQAGMIDDRTNTGFSCGGCAYQGFYVLVGADAPWTASIRYDMDAGQQGVTVTSPAIVLRGNGLVATEATRTTASPAGAQEALSLPVEVNGTAFVAVDLPSVQGLGHYTLALPNAVEADGDILPTGLVHRVMLGTSGATGSGSATLQWNGLPTPLRAWSVTIPGAGIGYPAGFGEGRAVST